MPLSSVGQRGGYSAFMGWLIFAFVCLIVAVFSIERDFS